MKYFVNRKYILKAAISLVVALAFILPGAAMQKLPEQANQNQVRLADFEMSIGNYAAEAGDTGVTILVNGSWAESIGGYEIYLHFDIDNLEYWKVDYTGTFGDTANYQLAEIWEPGVLGFGCVWFPPYPGAGSGVLAKVIFNVSATATNGDTILDIDDYNDKPSTYSDTTGQSRLPEITDGVLTITGGVEPNNPPDAPTNPSPADDATDVEVSPILNVDVSDQDGDTMDVSFYDASDDSLIGTDEDVPDGGTGQFTWDTLDYDTTYEWYAIADDGEDATQSDTWSFTTIAPPEPDLDGSGDLSWTDIEPGATVDGSITVENVGEATSMLSWEVESYPDWGTWTFTPDSGDSLTPEAGSITIDVEVVAPDEQNQDFEGTVKIVNTEDSSDYFEVTATLSTPRVRSTAESWFFQIFAQLVERYPLLELIFGQYF